MNIKEMKMRVVFYGVALLSVLLVDNVQAQNTKMGYVRIEKIFAEWPETKRSNTELEEYESQLSSALQSKLQGFQTKLAYYEENSQAMDAVTKRDAETELQNLQTEIQEFEANAQQSIAQKNLELLNPLQDKLKETIDKVSSENGFTHVFAYGSSLVFASDPNGDISSLVAQKLGFVLSTE